MKELLKNVKTFLFSCTFLYKAVNVRKLSQECFTIILKDEKKSFLEYFSAFDELVMNTP